MVCLNKFQVRALNITLFFRYLAVAASLTGGNAMAAFIKMIQVLNIFFQIVFDRQY